VRYLPEGSRVQGFEDSSERKKDIAESEIMLKVLIKSLEKQTLESLTPGILGPSSPTKLEKNHIRFIKPISTKKNKDFFLHGRLFCSIMELVKRSIQDKWRIKTDIVFFKISTS